MSDAGLKIRIAARANFSALPNIVFHTFAGDDRRSG